MHIFHIVLHCVRFPFFCSPPGSLLVIITSIFFTAAWHALLDSQLLSAKGVDDERQAAFFFFYPAVARLEEDALCRKNVTEPTSPADLFFQRDYVAHHYSTLLCHCKDVIKSVFSFPLKCLVSLLFTYFYITKNLSTHRSVNTLNHIPHPSVHTPEKQEIIIDLHIALYSVRHSLLIPAYRNIAQWEVFRTAAMQKITARGRGKKEYHSDGGLGD